MKASFKNNFLLVTFLLLVCKIGFAQNINKPNKMGPMGTEVNTASGNLFIQRNDVLIPSRGFNVDLSFYYNSFLYDTTIGLGKGWSSSYSIQYKNDTANGKIIFWGDGREDAYKFSAGNFIAPKGFFNTLTQYQPNKYLLTQIDGTKYYFDNATNKKITKMEEPNGNSINFIYSDSLLTSITNSAGQSISLTYNGNGSLATVVDAIATPTRTFSYTYDSYGNLTKVTDPLNGIIKYSYLVNGPMKTMSDKNNNTIDIIYYNDYTVREIIGCNKRQSFAYDTATKVTMVTDYLANGDNQITKYEYQKQNETVWLKKLSGNCCGFNMQFEFDANGNKIKETDANGNVTQFTSDNRGNVLTIKDALNQTITYTYNTAFNTIKSFTDKKGNVYNFTYDAKGNLTQLTEPGNLNYNATYNANGDIISSTDAKGNTYNYNYDSYGNPTTVTGPNGYIASLVYDARGNLVSVKDYQNKTSTLQYDVLNRLKIITDPIANIIEYNYDAEGNITQVKNQNNEINIIKYDASNRPIEFTNEAGKKSYVTFDAMDNITKITNAVGASASLFYDTRNRLSSFKDAEGNTVAFEYDNKDNIIQTTFPDGNKFSYTFDNLDRVKTISDLNGSILQMSYDNNGNIINYTKANGGITNLSLDPLNRVTKIVDPLGNSKSYTYDNNKNITSVTDQNGSTTSYTYDSLDRIKSFTDNNGFTTSAVYDVRDNIISLTDANNNITNYTYDSVNRVKKIIYPDSKFIEFYYDKEGNIISKKLTDGSIINFTYDSLNRIITKQMSDGQIYNYTYDEINRLKTASNASGIVTINYDAMNRIVSENFNGRIVKYEYNAAGNIFKTIYPDSTQVSKQYDNRKRLTRISKNGTSLVDYQYNNSNQIISKSFSNGINTYLQYDLSKRLTNINTANGLIQNNNYTYTNNGNKKSIERLNFSNKSEQFTYDNADRVTGFKKGFINGPYTLNSTYNYDSLGNRTSSVINGATTTYSSNNLNQLIQKNNAAQNINFVYDMRGNLTYDGKFYKFYDVENKIIKDSSAPNNVLMYKYDAFGRRVQKNYNGVVWDYSFSGLAQIEERNNSGAILNKTIFSNFLSPVENEKNGLSFYYHQNELNSVEAITKANGDLVEKYEYDVYGKQTIFDAFGNTLSGSITGNRFGFTGQVYDSATAINKFLFREYSPENGTFNERDLIGYKDGMGMYQYVHNNPANGIDVFGLESGQIALDNLEQMRIEQEKKDPCERLKNNLLRLVNDDPTNYSLRDFFTDVKNINDLKEQFADIDKRINFGALEALDDISNKPIRSLNNGFGNLLALTSVFNDVADFAVNGKTKTNADLVGTVVKDFTSTVKVVNSLAGASPSYLAALESAAPNVSQFLKVGGEIAGAEVVAVASILEPGISFAAEKYYSNKQDPSALIPARVGDEDLSFQDRMAFNHTDNPFYRQEREQAIKNIEDKIQIANDKKNRKEQAFRKEFIHRIAAFLKKMGCPQNGPTGGTQKPPTKPNGGPGGAKGEGIASHDPNEIIGPDGQPSKHWVSVNDRLPYTITFENAKTAGAPAKYVKVITPIEPKQDAATFQLNSFAFNNLTFNVPTNAPSYYNRLDCRDSLGLYVDVTAGYDVVNNEAFWEFQSIDPVTLLPPTNPLVGFLLLQDSSKPASGHGFVNFSVKPKTSAVTLDTIVAKAKIVFDSNDTIPTNLHKNTIDAFAPTSHMNALPAISPNPVALSWTGTDDVGGCGVKSYTLYVSTNGVSFYILKSGITRTDTTIRLSPDSSYCFFVLATDSVGNMETLRPGEIKCTMVSGAVLPVTWLYFKGSNIGKDNLLEWATASEQNCKEFVLERSLTGNTFNAIATIQAAGNSSSTKVYPYKDANIDKLNSNVFFYRVKQIDVNGSFKYSNIVRLNYNLKDVPKSIVYPNPTQGLITVTIGDAALVGTLATVMDVNGRILQQVKITAQSQSFNFSSYTNGTYFIRLQNKEVMTIIKQ